LSELNHLKETVFDTRKDDQWRYDGIQSNKRQTHCDWSWLGLEFNEYQLSTINYQNYIDDPNNSSFVEVITGYDDLIDRVKRIIKEDRVDLYADNELVIQYVLDRLNLNSDLKIVPQSLEKMVDSIW
jgi:polar amino acid transport system substrate-binding protein